MNKNYTYHIITDLDRVPELSAYDRKRVCVPRQCRSGCSSTAICPYRQHMQDSMAHPALFQVCNHHYFLADMTHWEQDIAPIIPHYRGVIIDEAHQFYSAVQTICGKDISNEKVESLLTDLRNMRMNTLANKLSVSFDRLFKAFFCQARVCFIWCVCPARKSRVDFMPGIPYTIYYFYIF